jgi:hypothetical protein
VIAHHDLAGADQRREGRALDRDHLAGRDLVDHPPPKDVAARVDPVSLRPRCLLQECCDPPAGIDRHAAEPGRVGHLDQVQRHRGVVPGVQLELSAEIMAGEDVAVQHHHRVLRAAVQARGGVPDAAAGAERHVLLDALKLQPELRSVAELLGEHLGPVRGRQHHPADPGRSRPRQLVREERHSGGRQQRLGRRDGQRAQPGTLPADQQNRLNPGISPATRSWLPGGP